MISNIRVATFVLMMLYSGSIGSQSKNITIEVDERMEFITTLQYLSGYFLVSQKELDYKKDIDRYFSKHKEHKAVDLLRKIQGQFFSFNRVPMILYHYSFPDFEQIHPFTEEEKQQIDFKKHKSLIEEFFKAAKDFYIESKFHIFYKKHQSLYDELIKSVKNEIDNYEVINVMEDHYGMSQKTYNLVLTPLLHDGGFATRIVEADGANLYAIIGPSEATDGRPSYNSEKLLQDYVIHEFSHTFCNPIIDANFEALEKTDCLFEPIKESMKKQAYTRWKSCLYEHLVRANEVILTKKIKGIKASNLIYEDFVQHRNFVYLQELVPILEMYDDNRSKFKNLNSIMPDVIQYFNEQAKKCQ